ncbi:MAG: nuclear transport factor 2 family protein [Actinomycetota bacterium]|nr:nuclear transport factor 2 family protein [Actinomycetota bacterium]
MSEESVEIADRVRRLFAAFNERDWSVFSVELDPEVEYTPVEEHAAYHGPEKFAEYLKGFLEFWEPFLGEAEEIEITPAEDCAFVAMRFRGRGKGSGVDIDDRLFWAGELRGGRLYRISEYTDRQEALEAAGLSE